MHQILHIPEIVFNITSHFSTPTTLSKGDYSADLAVLARTCKAFQEPALDVLWEELHDFSPLARCLPEACRSAGIEEKPERYIWFKDQPCYLFHRPLKEEEWETLRGYARRVRFIHGSPVGFASLNEESIRVIFSLAPFTDPLFPRLRSLRWREAFSFAPLHAAVPSLTTLHLNFLNLTRRPVKGFFDAFGDRCPHIKKLVVDVQPYGLVDSIIPSGISRQICHWPNLQRVHCYGVALNVHAISYLSSVPTLEWLAFTLKDDLIRDIANLGSKLVFSNLTDLHVGSSPLDIITSLLPHIRLPAVKTICVIIPKRISKRSIRAYWAGVREACSSDVISSLQLRAFDLGHEGIPLDDDELSELTLEDLRPCTAFAELRELHITLDCSVNLVDTDILELALPRMEVLRINDDWGWQLDMDEGGITLRGFVQLLQQCPSLHFLCLAIDTRTFTEIPEGLDVSFSPRKWLEVNFVDSYMLPEFVPGVASVLAVLGLEPSTLRVWQTREWEFSGGEEYRPLWERVLDELRSASQ